MSEIRWNESVVSSILSKCKDAVHSELQDILVKSKALVPVEDGDLRDSGTVTVNNTEGVVSYNTPYAVRQHEDMTLRHPRGGQAKYLERVLPKNVQSLGSKIKW